MNSVNNNKTAFVSGKDNENTQRTDPVIKKEDFVTDANLLDAYSKAVIHVVDNVGPANRAGILEGDQIIAIHEKNIENVDDLHRFLSEWPVGNALPLTILRGIEKLKVYLTPTEAP